ncbi:uncharacterized protein [Amphiura filiformis]|uniref:uncharacterized protein n=1 Tax=Amphiura filiformis TaxID=82378 RepID=UPI003B21922A
MKFPNVDTMSSSKTGSTGRRRRSRRHITLPSGEGADSSQDESLEVLQPLDVTQIRAQFEKTPGRLPIAMTPMRTPARNGKVTAIDPLRDRLQSEDDIINGEKQISPGLKQLRQTPGRALQKQKILEQKFHAAKSKVSSANVGGGISVWPEMEDMRLTSKEVWGLVLICIGLTVGVYVGFQIIHGALMLRLDHYNLLLKSFSSNHEIDSRNQDSFNTSVLHWHMEFTNLMDSIHQDFDVDWYEVPMQYQLLVVLYLAGIGVLLYFLIDNMFAKNKLTPWRIKNWVSILVVIGCWSVLIVGLLVKAQRLEYLVESNVHSLSRKLSDLVFEDLDLTKYNNILLLWRTCCLPPTTLGTLSIMGVFQVRDVSYYVQYYSLPVLTALLTPVIRLIIALNEVYATPKQAKLNISQ